MQVKNDGVQLLTQAEPIEVIPGFSDSAHHRIFVVQVALAAHLWQVLGVEPIEHVEDVVDGVGKKG